MLVYKNLANLVIRTLKLKFKNLKSILNKWLIMHILNNTHNTVRDHVLYQEVEQIYTSNLQQR